MHDKRCRFTHQHSILGWGSVSTSRGLQRKWLPPQLFEPQRGIVLLDGMSDVVLNCRNRLCVSLRFLGDLATTTVALTYSERGLSKEVVAWLFLMGR